MGGGRAVLSRGLFLPRPTCRAHLKGVARPLRDRSVRPPSRADGNGNRNPRRDFGRASDSRHRRRDLGLCRARDRAEEAGAGDLRNDRGDPRIAARRNRRLPLLPLITDRHVDAFTLAGTIDEVAEHAIALHQAGVDGVIARPFAAEGWTIEQTIATLGTEVWPRVLG